MGDEVVLPPSPAAEQTNDAAEDAPSTSGTEEFLCLFAHHLLDFRKSEVESLAALAGVKQEQLSWRRPHGDSELSPFWYLRLPPAAVKATASRALLTKGMFEVWGEGANWEELQASVEAYPTERKAPWFAEDISFRIVVDTFGIKIPAKEQVDLIERIEPFLPFLGRVDLKHAEARFWLFVCDCRGLNGLPDSVPYRLYFAREIAVSDRSYIDRYTLRKRRYIGPTSMDHEMAFIMANHAKVRRGSLVLDPYVGTGSVIIAAAHYGARVLGADIDVKVLKEGKAARDGGEGRVDCFSNFDQYHLQRPDGLLRMDMHRPPFRPGLEEVLDAVIGDPPYGVRAGGKKSGPREGVVIRDITNYFPSLLPYSLAETLRDLLDISARLLVLGGRLVFFMPATPETYSEEELPQHPCLRIMANCEQILTRRYSRRLVTMEKVKRYDAAEAAAYHEACGEPVMAIDGLRDLVYEDRRAGTPASVAAAPPGPDRPFRSKAH